MATVTVKVGANGTYTAWTRSNTGVAAYTLVDEDGSTQDGASTYIFSQTADQRSSFTLLSSDYSAIQSGDTINSITVYAYTAYVVIPYNYKLFLRLGGNNTDGTEDAPDSTSYTVYSETLARPGGGSWAYSDLSTLELGILRVATSTRATRCTAIYCVIDYTPSAPTLTATTGAFTLTGTAATLTADRKLGAAQGTFSLTGNPATGGYINWTRPTNLLCDRATNPTTASEFPIFSAIYNSYGIFGSAKYANIQVSESTSFASPYWDSGWLGIATTADGVRSSNLRYSGSALASDPTNSKYFWRIRFSGSAANTTSVWSTADSTTPSEFTVTIRDWIDRSLGYAFRKKITFNTDHPLIPAGYTAEVDVTTGTRKIIATDANYNEGIQFPGQQVIYHDGRTHVVYLTRINPTNGYCDIAVVSFDHLTETWGDPYTIASAFTSFDTHYYPTCCVDNSGYIHVFYGCHDSTMYHRRSTNPNESGSLPGDAGWGFANTPAGNPAYATYPCAFVVPSTGRIYVFFRNSFPTATQRFAYSDNNGSTWSTPKTYISDSAAGAYRIYAHGFRFDPVYNRVHSGITFDVQPGGSYKYGVWYIYSDFEESGDGFNTWKLVDGTTVGTTTTSPYDRNNSEAIILSDDCNGYFINHIGVTNAGDPLVFFTRKFIPLSADPNLGSYPTTETYLLMAKWNGSIWDVISISDPLNTKMRVGRGGISCTQEKSGKTIVYMPVGGRQYKEYLPTADVISTDVTRSAGANNYSLLADGLDWCDGDTTYISLAAGTGKATFTNTTTLPDYPHYLYVTISAVAKYITTNPSCRLCLVINGTTYDSSAFSLTTAYDEYTYTWYTNPDTSAPWTKSELESLEFGFRDAATGDARITRIKKQVRVSLSNSLNWYGSEIVQLTSAAGDDGSNWSMSTVSQNSGVGVPMLSEKWAYTNEQIEVAWVSGGDIFYMTNNPWGKCRNDANDVRVYYGTTEIDRVMNYTNLNDSKIYFPIQEDIQSGKTAGPKDYFIYYGNLQETTYPLSNPDNVFTLYESFEGLHTGDSLNGFNGWSVTAGAGTVYSSPPSHASKTYAGENSIETGTSFTASKTITTLENAYVQASFWNESSSGKTYLRVYSGTDSYSVGLNADTDRAGYASNGTWADSSTVAKGATFLRVAIQVTPTNCKCWLNDTLINTGTSPIQDVDKIELHCDGQTYWDYIWVTQKLDVGSTHDPAITASTEEPSGFYVDASLKGNGADLFLMDAELTLGISPPAATFTLTGQDASLAAGKTFQTDQATFNLTGSEAELVHGYNLVATSQSFTVNGQDAGLVNDHPLPADVETFTVTGSAASFDVGIPAITGEFSLTGNAADVTTQRVLEAASSSFTLTGVPAPLIAGKQLSSDNVGFTVTGNAADLTQQKVLVAEVASFTLIGSDVGRQLEATPASFTITGIDAEFLHDHPLSSDVGEFALTGSSAELTQQKVLVAEVANFTLTGNYATLTSQLVLQADTDSYILSGFDVDASHAYQLIAGTSSFIVTGIDVEISYVIPGRLDAVTHAFIVTGHNVSFVKDTPLPADPDSFAITGNDVNLTHDYVLVCTPASISVSGIDSGLSYGRGLEATVSSFTTSGTDAQLKVDRKLIGSYDSNSTFLVDGKDINLAYHRALNAETATFRPKTLPRSYVLTAETDAYYVGITCEVGPFIVTTFGATLLPSSGSNNTPIEPPTTTVSVDPDALPGGRVGRGPGGGGGYGNRSIDDIYTDRKLSQVRKKRATISKQDDEEIMTVISAFLRMVDDEEEA